MLKIKQGLLVIVMVCPLYGIKQQSSKGEIMSIINKKDLNQNIDLAIDMYQKDGNVIVKMDVPGIQPADIKVEIEDGQLHIFGERKIKEEVKNASYYYKETEYGMFDRLISLPQDISPAGMAYDVVNGVLTVIIPKK